MADFDDLIGKDIDDLRQTVSCFGGGKIAALEMGMPVEMVTRLCHAQEPINGFQPLMRLGIVIVNAKRRRVRDEDIEETTISAAVQQQAGQHAECSKVSVRL